MGGDIKNMQAKKKTEDETFAKALAKELKITKIPKEKKAEAQKVESAAQSKCQKLEAKLDEMQTSMKEMKENLSIDQGRVDGLQAKFEAPGVEAHAKILRKGGCNPASEDSAITAAAVNRAVRNMQATAKAARMKIKKTARTVKKTETKADAAVTAEVKAELQAVKVELKVKDVTKA